jgi:hypothetical protein
LEVAFGLKSSSIVRYLEPSARQSAIVSAASDPVAAPFIVSLFFEEFRLRSYYAWRVFQFERTDTEAQITFSHPAIYQDGVRLCAYRRVLSAVEHMRVACEALAEKRTKFEIDLNAEQSPDLQIGRIPPTHIIMCFEEFRKGRAWRMSGVQWNAAEYLKSIRLPLPKMYICRERVRMMGQFLLEVEQARRTGSRTVTPFRCGREPTMSCNVIHDL